MITKSPAATQAKFTATLCDWLRKNLAHSKSTNQARVARSMVSANQR